MAEYDYSKLDELLHSRIRIAAVTALSLVEEGEFTWLREKVGATDGNLSTHLRKLEDAGYVEVRKAFEGRKPVTYYSLSVRGREALEVYIARLLDMTGKAAQRE
jgi:DNA-binding transcriptional ArsR family regulator